MSSLQTFPLRLPAHRRAALLLGLRLVAWARTPGPERREQTAAERESALRRYRTAREAELERERALVTTMSYARLVI